MSNNKLQLQYNKIPTELCFKITKYLFNLSKGRKAPPTQDIINFYLKFFAPKK